MKFLITFPAIFIITFNTIMAQINFDDYFLDETMRIDYFHAGDSKTEFITIDNIYRYGIWAGSKKNLLDNFNNGKYYIKIYNFSSGELIYSKGFDTYFGEYQSSDKALNGISKSYHETAIIPYPKNKIKFSIEKRDDKNLLAELFNSEIDPEDVIIIKDKILDKNVKIFKLLENGDPHVKVDVAIIGEGYTEQEEEKFKLDLERFTNIFFDREPYSSLKDNFNVYGALKPSEESGTDESEAGIHKNTTLNTTFNSLGSERYLLTEDNKTLRDIAAHVPYDALYIMVNHRRYGGGGIYNWVCTFTADNQWSDYLFHHEFGHSFAGLADEYYTSDVAYNDFFKRTVEPVEPNITALLDKDNLKWKDKLTPEIELPTPWEKAHFDSTDLKWQAERRELNKKVADLKRGRAPIAAIRKAEEEYDKKDREHSEVIQKMISESKFDGKVGAFEGAGYASQGLYRPMLDCIMFTKGERKFCVVCEEAIRKVIMHYSE